ncbi:MAG: hypothetical protein Aurels2KO_21680 [Aureliella sp.]
MSRKKKTIDDDALDAILNEAAEASDFTFPTTVEQVKATEGEACPPLPPHLQNPLELLGQRDEGEIITGHFPSYIEVQPSSEESENRAMAARNGLNEAAENGGDVSPPIRRKMDTDRDQAERDLEQDDG